MSELYDVLCMFTDKWLTLLHFLTYPHCFPESDVIH